MTDLELKQRVREQNEHQRDTIEAAWRSFVYRGVPYRRTGWVVDSSTKKLHNTFMSYN